MSPADILAAARANVVGPYLPARAAWTEGWTGPCEVSSVHDWKEGVVLRGGRLLMTYGGRSVDVGFDRCTPRLDTRRPEIRDHLVRLGCPEKFRDVPSAVWAWGMWGHPLGVLLEWHQTASGHVWHRAGLAATQTTVSVSADGWRVLSIVDESGPETGDLGRACADLAAINAGCIVREPGGWLVPMPDGGIGFFEEVNRDE